MTLPRYFHFLIAAIWLSTPLAAANSARPEIYVDAQLVVPPLIAQFIENQPTDDHPFSHPNHLNKFKNKFKRIGEPAIPFLIAVTDTRDSYLRYAFDLFILEIVEDAYDYQGGSLTTLTKFQLNKYFSENLKKYRCRRKYRSDTRYTLVAIGQLQLDSSVNEVANYLDTKCSYSAINALIVIGPNGISKVEDYFSNLDESHKDKIAKMIIYELEKKNNWIERNKKAKDQLDDLEKSIAIFAKHHPEPGYMSCRKDKRHTVWDVQEVRNKIRKEGCVAQPNIGEPIPASYTGDWRGADEGYYSPGPSFNLDDCGLLTVYEDPNDNDCRIDRILEENSRSEQIDH